MRQHFAQPWVPKACAAARCGSASACCDGSWRYDRCAAGAHHPVPSPGGNNAPDYLVQTGDCRILPAVSGRLADAADQMRFACPEAPDAATSPGNARSAPPTAPEI